MMQFVAQASHEIVPPDVMEPVLRALVNNFVTERNSSDVMAIGYINYFYPKSYIIMCFIFIKD